MSTTLPRVTRTLAYLTAVVIIGSTDGWALESPATFSERDLYAVASATAGYETARSMDPNLVFSTDAQSISDRVTVEGITTDTGLASTHSATAAVNGNVDFGHVSVLARASALSGPTGNQNGASGSAFLTLGWRDYVVLQSDALPAGTPVDVYVGAALERTILGQSTLQWNPVMSNPADRTSPPSIASGVVNGLFSFNNSSLPGDGGSVTFSSCFGISGVASCAPGYSYDARNFTVRAQVGSTLDFYAYASVSADAGGAPYYADAFSAQVEANASDTMSFALRVLTPGVRYESASGVVFAAELPVAAVPEPHVATLTFVGLALVGYAVRRSWKRA